MNRTDMNVSRRETHDINRFDIVLAILYAVVILVGIFGNAMVIAVVWKTRTMHTATNYLLVNLAASDILVLLWCPHTYNFAIVGSIPEGKLGDNLCRFFIGDPVDTLCIGVTLFTLSVLAVERYQALVTPMRTKYTLTKTSVVYAIAITWILSLAISIPDFVLTHVDISEGRCVSPLSVEANTSKAKYIAVLITFFILLPLLVITFCYCQILRGMFIKKTICAGPANLNSEKKKLATLIIAVTVAFYIVFLPFGIFMLHAAFSRQDPREGRESIGFQIAFKFLTFLIVVNSSLNPILYAFQSENYRKGFKNLFCLRSNSVSPHENNFALGEQGQIPRIHLWRAV